MFESLHDENSFNCTPHSLYMCQCIFAKYTIKTDAIGTQKNHFAPIPLNTE